MEAQGLDALRIALFYVAWPGMLAVSGYALLRAFAFNRAVRQAPVGRLVLLMVIGWVLIMASLGGVASLIVHRQAAAGVVVLPFFVVWACSMALIVWIVHRWGAEAVNINLYYLEMASMDEVKTQLINTVAHELNTPLTPIKLKLDMMARGSLGPLTERQAGAVASIGRNLDRLGALVDQVVLATQIQSGHLQVAREKVELDAAVERLLGSAQGAAAEHGLALERELGCGCVLSADRPRLERVIASLLGNALKFTPRGGTVKVSTRRAGDRAVVEVADSGLGMSPEQRASLFQPFRSVHDTMQHTDSGAGLSLYIARGIAEAHGGALTAMSDGPGKGSVFRLELPLGT